MRKMLVLWFTIFLIFGLMGCEGIKTSDDLNREFQEHLDYVRLDYEEKITYFNRLSTETLLSVVKIQKTSYFPYASSMGSGVIFTQNETHFFILTNAHVVYSQNQTNTIYSIIDYQGNRYTGDLLAEDSSYDLAVLRIPKGELAIHNMAFASKNPDIGARSAILGYPSDQANAITLGSVLSYQKVNIKDSTIPEIQIDFEIIVADNPVKPGSSGSVVVNQNMQLVGILYAGNFSDSSSVSKFSFSIPVEKVIEFLVAQGFTSMEVRP